MIILKQIVWETKKVCIEILVVHAGLELLIKTCKMLFGSTTQEPLTPVKF